MTVKRNSRLASLAVSYAKSFIGVPYLWGGETPMTGFDCSGLAQEILASVGLDPIGDQTADALMKHYVKKVTQEPVPGTLIFFGKNNKASHVGFSIGNGLMIEAGSGNAKTNNLAMAVSQKAFVRVRPIHSRKDVLCYLDVFLLDTGS